MRNGVVYESELVFPIVGCVDADNIVETIRETGAPIIVARFEAVTGAEAQELLGEINWSLRSMRLPEFPAVRRRYLR